KMGYALAEAARDRGAGVVLISAPTGLRPPYGTQMIPVTTAQEMRDAVARQAAGTDVLIMAAAVADYRPSFAADNKIKKSGKAMTLVLEETPDILTETKAPGLIKVGFAAESEGLVANARQKLEKKGLDLIVANDITAEGSGFGSETNRVTIIHRGGKMEELPTLMKSEVAHQVLDRVAALVSARPKGKG
ncbi:MAG: bifunctional 4'-phosphopantothenoylcysteine decarboxylase/phosphopantothenoylcysteine synthetase, partial [Chloroflexi bacterium]|nr:bifunctional 4'-phosphopantothenoylcysteine decarboxylase/phosphopantothenoylcysteine synthetase [Chloroflexota bacterium]